jgi:Fe-S cluster assembly iron-binding protein IscA
MVTVTSEARVILDNLRGDAIAEEPTLQEAQPSPALRLVIQNSQAALALDQPRDGDQVIEHDGKPLLLVDPEIAQALADITIDVQETPEGGRLTLTRSDSNGSM